MDYMLNREPSSELCKLENTPSLGDIRIIDDDIVQIYLNETWGNICVPDNDASSVANVVCRQLGWRTLNLVHRYVHKLKCSIFLSKSMTFFCYSKTLHTKSFLTTVCYEMIEKKGTNHSTRGFVA